MSNTLIRSDKTWLYNRLQIVELRAEALHLRTRDKFLTTELEDRNNQISKLKLLLDRKQVYYLKHQIQMYFKQQIQIIRHSAYK